MCAMTDLAKTDEEIKIEIVDELRRDTRLDSSKLQVLVDDGSVTLTGTVPSWSARGVAETDAASIVGVTGVANRVMVSLPNALAVPTDDTIRNNAESTLDWNPDLDSINTTVEVNEGVVILRGTVLTHWDKVRAEELIGVLRGVVSVVNELAVVPTDKFTDEVIAEDIMLALERNTIVDAGSVEVTVGDGLVTLTGTVQSAASRRAAHDAASRTAGVVAVSNDLVVIQ